jgi:hypothetical protein
MLGLWTALCIAWGFRCRYKGNETSAKIIPTPPDDRRLEQVKLELSTRLEEYKALRAEIVATLSSAYLTTNLSITAIGILIAGAPFIISYQTPILFLLASYSFHFIAWTQLRYEQAVFNMSQHVVTVVAPGVRQALSIISGNSSAPSGDVLSWESSGRRLNHPSMAWSHPIEAARYILPLLAGAVTGVSYLVNRLKLPFRESWESPAMWMAFASSCTLFGYSVFLTYRTRSQLKGVRQM